MGFQREGQTYIGGNIIDRSRAQRPQERQIFLSAAAADRNQRDLVCIDRFCGFAKSAIVCLHAIVIGPRGRIGFVEGEPFLGLFLALVVEAMVHAAGAERFDIRRARSFGKNGGMDCDVNGPLHLRNICK